MVVSWESIVWEGIWENPDFLEPTQFILSEPERHKALGSWDSFGIGKIQLWNWEGALALPAVLGWVRLEELGGTAGCPCLWGHHVPHVLSS